MLDQQIRALSEVDQSRKSDSQELDRLRNQNAQLSQERSSLVRHLETLTSEIKRTKLEKDFVEDRLLSMVEETDAPRSVPSSA
jgi:regulator of replication initiation timing